MATLTEVVNSVDNARKGLITDIRNKGVVIKDSATLNDCRVGVQNIQAGGGDVQGLIFNDIKFKATEAKVIPPDFFVGKTSLWEVFKQMIRIKKLPFFDTSTITEFARFAVDCGELVEVPQYDTSNGTDMREFFCRTKKLKNIPHLNTSKAVNWPYCFLGAGLEQVPDWDFSAGKYFYECFSGCENLLTAKLSLKKGEDLQSMFSLAKNLKSVELLDMENSPGNNYAGMFWHCDKLTSITGLGLGTGGQIYRNMFIFDAALETLTIAGNIKRFGNNADTFIDFSPCVALSHESLMNIINALESGTEHAPSLKLGAANEAKLTPEELQLITTKGWTLAQ